MASQCNEMTMNSTVFTPHCWCIAEGHMKTSLLLLTLCFSETQNMHLNASSVAGRVCVYLFLLYL